MSTMQRYEPWSLLSQMQHELSDIFPGWRSAGARQLGESNVETSQWAPRVDIKEEPNRFIVLADIPGVDPEQIDITMENQVLTIKGEKVLESEDKKDNYTRKERFEGRFYRHFTLPETADSEQISAQYRKGVLEISIPKKEQIKPRKIEVKVSEDNNGKAKH
jgi:HSP20 family protein